MGIELKGKFNTAKVYTDVIDNATISQVLSILNLEVYKDNTIRIMPDCCAGVGCVVGTTMTISDALTPNLVGVDIGCGMLAIKLKEKRIDLPKFDSILRKVVPSGGSVFDTPSSMDSDVEYLRCIKHKAPIKVGLAYCSLGTLGGGNHFIELDKDEETDDIWLVIHTGSRHLGIEVCNHYQKAAYDELKLIVNKGGLASRQAELIEQLKKEGKKSKVEDELKRLKRDYREIAPDVPYELAYCKGGLLEDYLHDMKIVQAHASHNRATIAKNLLKAAKLHEVERFETIHNYIDVDNMILRKGAVSAQDGETLIIPINMRDGSLICKGKGNVDWNYSAPHGAGRLYSRSEAKARFSLSEYKKTMESAGIYTTSVNKGTLDECPMAYKDLESIVDNIGDTVEVVKLIKPIYNFKASSIDD